MGAPGPDDPRYWERLRQGPPLDDWVDFDASPNWHAEAEARHTRDRRRLRVGAFAIVAVVVAAIGWGIFTSEDGGGDPAACAAPSDTPCMSSDGVVRWIDLGGAYQYEPLERWRQERDAAAEDQDGSPPVGPGPVTP